MLFQIAATLSMAIDKGVDASFPNLMSQLININNDSFYNSKLKHSIEYLSLFDKLLTEQPPQGLKTYRYPLHYDATIPMIASALRNMKTIDDLLETPYYVEY